MVGNSVCEAMSDLNFILNISTVYQTGNLRTVKDNIDLSEIAKILGGWWS